MIDVNHEFQCPVCGTVHHMKVEREFLDSPDHWKRNGYIQVFCFNCRNRVTA